MEKKAMANYYQEGKNADARVVLSRLKLELGCRETNDHIGSGLGGNPTELFFLMTHPVKCVGIDEGDPRFERVGLNEVLFYSTKKPPMKMVRTSLSNLLKESFPSHVKVTQNQLLNPSFLADHVEGNLEIKLLRKALIHTAELVKWLDLKIDMQKKLGDLSDTERADQAVLFLREMELPETYFQDTKDEKGNPIKRMLDRHPVYGARRKAISERYGAMIKQLISPEDNQKLEMMGAYPPHIGLFAFRTQVSIERIVCLNLDELPSCNFLAEINKEIDGKDEK